MASVFPDEAAVARYWWSLPLQSILPLRNGNAYQLLFAGRSGGAAGPDVRDAVFCTVEPYRPLHDQGLRNRAQTRRCVGDVEFHMRSSDWVTHRHDTDPRYNNVVLHVVLLCDDPASTRRQDGLIVPLCTLYDLPIRSGVILQQKVSWPCQHMSIEACSHVLEEAGLLRFEQKTHTFVEQLHASSPILRDTGYDACLIPALAEGMGYGRDRALFRAVGLRLLGLEVTLPEPAGRASGPTPLDAGRLRSLRLLVERWRDPGVWLRLRAIVQPSPQPAVFTRMLSLLRSAFCDLGLSLARTDILICNIVLPFAAAVALLEHDAPLGECAQTLYRKHPGLSSNSITRMMTAQLQLPMEPQGSCCQQGLHYIYHATCREKYCTMCSMSRRLEI